MKLLLTNPTGHIGTHTLLHALSHPSITSIVTLSRRALPQDLLAHPLAASKLTPLVLEDFLVYPASVVEVLNGTDACIWALGPSSGSGAGGGSAAEVTVQYPLACARKFLSSIARAENERGRAGFRFVYVSCAAALSPAAAAKLPEWLLPASTKQRREVEAALAELHAVARKSGEARWETVIARPGWVVGGSSAAAAQGRRDAKTSVLVAEGAKELVGAVGAVGVDELVAGLVECAVEEGAVLGGGRGDGWEGKPGLVVLDAEEVRARGQRALERWRMAERAGGLDSGAGVGVDAGSKEKEGGEGNA